MPEDRPHPHDEEPRDYAPDAYVPIFMGRALEHANETIDQLQYEKRQLIADLADARSEARTDALTGLPNRKQLNEDMARLTTEKSGQFGALFIDIDGLSETNTAYGHAAGDQLIQQAAEALRVSTRHTDPDRPEDTTGRGGYRLAGDEMIVILQGVHGQDDIDKVTERLHGRLAERGVNASIHGRMHRRGESVKDFIIAIDSMMYAVKRERKRQAYSPRQHAAIQEIGRLAARYNINLRDVPLVLEVTEHHDDSLE